MQYIITKIMNCHEQSLQVYAIAHIFMNFQEVYGITKILRDFQRHSREVYGLFFIIPMEKQAINFPKIVHIVRSCCRA